MAKREYNTFLVYDCRSRRATLVTSSARKASSALCPGIRVEVWSGNSLMETIYARDKEVCMEPYIRAEREYIALKQRDAERKNARKKCAIRTWKAEG